MSYTWNLPTKVLFGVGKVNELRGEKMPGRKALLVISNGKSVRENGALGVVEDALSSSGVDYLICSNRETCNDLSPGPFPDPWVEMYNGRV